MRRSGVFRLIRHKTLELLNNYIQVGEIIERVDEYVVPAQLGDNAGVLGAIALALDATKAEPERQKT